MANQGLIQVYTGDGKGKTTAGVGQAVRARGAGFAVCFIQFIKGGKESAELAMLRTLGVEVIRPATASTGLLGSGITAEDRQAAILAWQAAEQAIFSEQWQLVVLDELHIALKNDLVPLDIVLAALKAKPRQLEIVTTGRHAPPALCALADLVTEMVMIKHPFQVGIAARRGIEF